jgi:hypothetical protein
VGGLAEELAGFRVEDAFVGGRAVGPHEGRFGRPAMDRGQLVKTAITGLAGGVEDQGDVHHDVDEQALRPDE